MTAPRPTRDEVEAYVRQLAGGQIPAPALRRIAGQAAGHAHPLLAARRAVDAYLAELDDALAEGATASSRQTHPDRTASTALRRVARSRGQADRGGAR